MKTLKSNLQRLILIVSMSIPFTAVAEVTINGFASIRAGKIFGYENQNPEIGDLYTTDDLHLRMKVYLLCSFPLIWVMVYQQQSNSCRKELTTLK
ncbi:hypothetical protein ABVT43_06220 [Aliikangiella sp. GXAS 311]|uniref:Uncharacterized protein n=1 Tax=Aliikangiella maris TaxID=3162458 RepID=A0ABV2BS55_9GAMM